mmetsp:Transcript_113705/g.226268  ORF Transcript_113705/g.226268 Transcript_113705/m.226268 type:complete len:224 (-) Transcript_113705:252-923(-)
MQLGSGASAAASSHDGREARPVQGDIGQFRHSHPDGSGCRSLHFIAGETPERASSKVFADMVHGLNQAGSSSRDAALREHSFGRLVRYWLDRGQRVHLVCGKPPRCRYLRHWPPHGLHAPSPVCCGEVEFRVAPQWTLQFRRDAATLGLVACTARALGRRMLRREIHHSGCRRCAIPQANRSVDCQHRGSHNAKRPQNRVGYRHGSLPRVSQCILRMGRGQSY